jgi:predicted transcriptional regulator of viral defense system
MELIQKLKEYAVFSALDVENILGKSRQYAYLFIQRLKMSNLIYEIEKGRYTCHRDPFLIASRIVWPSYMSGWIALQYHHLTEQLPSTIEVVTTRSRKQRKIEFMNVRIEFSIVDPTHFFGYEKIEYKGQSIFIANKEKALLDALFLRHISPNEFKDILKSKKISIRRLRSYAKRISRLFSSKVETLVSK